MRVNHTYQGKALEVLKTLPDQCVDCCVTSPPYWRLRDYGVEGQQGLEETPEQYVAGMVAVFDEVRRMLKDEGTLWLNLGDSYASHGKDRTIEQAQAKSTLAERKHGGEALKQQCKITGDLKPKDLVGIPWMVAFALRSAGWYLRSDIIWSKPNPMPESVRDRPTKAHEYIFLLSKSARYYYDADAIKQEPVWDKDGTGTRKRKLRQQNGKKSSPTKMKNGIRPPKDKQRGHSRRHAGFNDRWDQMTKEEQQAIGANKRTVWTVPTMPIKEAHFAVFPEKLIVDCIKAGCPEGGVVLDPYAGAHTTPLVSRKLNRNYLAIELSAKYIGIGAHRLINELGMFQ